MLCAGVCVKGHTCVCANIYCLSHSCTINVVRGWHLWTQDKICDSPTYNVCDSNAETRSSIYHHALLSKHKKQVSKHKKTNNRSLLYESQYIEIIKKDNYGRHNMLNAVLIVWHVLNDFFKKGKRAWENDICKIRTNKKKGEAHTFAMSSPFTGSSIICSQASGFFFYACTSHQLKTHQSCVMGGTVNLQHIFHETSFFVFLRNETNYNTFSKWKPCQFCLESFGMRNQTGLRSIYYPIL